MRPVDHQGERPALQATRDWYRGFATEARGSSPTYERLALAVAEDPELLERLAALPAPKRQPNLLFGAVRFLGGPVDDPADFHRWTLHHWDRVCVTMLARRTQTNEVGRAATLLPVLASLPGPLALVEVGASAGLCLYPDRFHYRYRLPGPDVGDGAGRSEVTGGVEHTVGDPDSPVSLSCAVTGPAPVPTRLPDVVWREGIDLNPLDVTDEEDMAWLASLVWPDQPERLERLQGAISIARTAPPQLLAGDLMTALEPVVARAPRDATLVVLHSAVLAYLPAAQREAFGCGVRQLPGHWISNEGAGVLPRLEQGARSHGGPEERFLMALDGRPLAWTGPHGQSLDWFADPQP